MRLLLLVPLLWGGIAGAKGDEAVSDPRFDRSVRCYAACMEPVQDCKKKCGKRAACVPKCSKGIDKCTRKCGGPPRPPPAG